MTRALIFCRVIDNYGDAGVAWRLVERCCQEGLVVTLVIDDLKTLGLLVPAVGVALQSHPETTTIDVSPDLQIVHWNTFTNTLQARPRAEVVVETFGCRLDDQVEAWLAEVHPHRYVNLEYLSAESWVEGSHGLPGPHPRLPLTKIWFFPGFTDRTGGVMIEPDLALRQAAFDRAAWRKAHGLDPHLETAYILTYPTQDMQGLVKALHHDTTPRQLILAPGAAGDWLANELKDTPHVRLLRPGFVPHAQFDEWLWACDWLIIRGEDSFVRAQLAGIPFLWTIYPTEDFAHHIKLDAWLKLLEAQTGMPALYQTLAQRWGKATMTQEDWMAFWQHRTAFEAPFMAWKAQLFKRGCLLPKLLGLNSDTITD